MRDRVAEAIDIAGCLNEIYVAEVDHSLSSSPSLAQHRSQHSIFQQLSRMKRPSSKCTEREAIEELLRLDVTYNGDCNMNTVRPFNKDLVSLPDVGTRLVPLAQVLDAEGREVVESPSERMLLDEETWGSIAEQGAGFRPCVDTILNKNPEVYNAFVMDLCRKNLINFTNTPLDLIALFFVTKKSGKLRMVLDCRGVNRRFHPPPPLAMSAESTWAQVNLPADQQLYIAQSDIRDYFYALEMPTELQDLFCMPGVPARLQ